MSDNPLLLIAYVGASAVLALVLLAAAPVFLLTHGLFLAWAWLSVLVAWVGADALHGSFEEERRNPLVLGFDRAAGDDRTVWQFRRCNPAGEWREVSRVVTTYEAGPDGRLRRVRREAR